MRDKMENIKIITTPDNVSFILEIKPIIGIADISVMTKKDAKSFLELLDDEQMYDYHIDTSEKVYFFNRLNIPDNHRNQGLGEQLLKCVLDFCQQNNAFLINTASNYGKMGQDNLINFYKKNGMTLVHPDGLLVYFPEHKPIIKNKIR